MVIMMPTGAGHLLSWLSTYHTEASPRIRHEPSILLPVSQVQGLQEGISDRRANEIREKIKQHGVALKDLNKKIKIEDIKRAKKKGLASRHVLLNIDSCYYIQTALG